MTQTQTPPTVVLWKRRPKSGARRKTTEFVRIVAATRAGVVIVTGRGRRIVVPEKSLVVGLVPQAHAAEAS